MDVSLLITRLVRPTLLRQAATLVPQRPQSRVPQAVRVRSITMVHVGLPLLLIRLQPRRVLTLRVQVVGPVQVSQDLRAAQCAAILVQAVHRRAAVASLAVRRYVLQVAHQAASRVGLRVRAVSVGRLVAEVVAVRCYGSDV